MGYTGRKYSARCSTQKQKENLERQKERLIEYADERDYKYEAIDELNSARTALMAACRKITCSTCPLCGPCGSDGEPDICTAKIYKYFTEEK